MDASCGDHPVAGEKHSFLSAIGVRQGRKKVGPSALLLLLDEFAHVQGAGSTADSIEIFNAATPALAQFRDDVLTIQTSTPWGRTGQLFRSYSQALAITPADGTARDPGTFVLWLPFWELYGHSEPANEIPMWPGGPFFPQTRYRK